MFKTIKKAARKALRAVGIRPKFLYIEKACLFGREFLVYEGTIRKKPDYDDAWLAACALHAGSVFDIGANVGQALFIMLAAGDIKRIIAADCNKEALAMAAENLSMNGLSDKVQFVCSFISDEADTSREFWTIGAGSAGSMYGEHARTAKEMNRHMTVTTTTIDDLCERYDTVPDLIKIDVEGAEALVVRGSSSCASRRKTRYFVEMHANPALPMAVNLGKVLDWCRAARYKAWYLKEKAELSRPDRLDHRGRCHILLQPEEWEFPGWLRGINEKDPVEKALPDRK